jgi:hypothetical protein
LKGNAVDVAEVQKTVEGQGEEVEGGGAVC